jgi:hypothetical protein
MTMTTNEYLKSVLDAQSLANDSDEMKALREARDAVETLLKNEFSGSSPSIRYGGSKAKGTMILENYDLDVICYFAHDDAGAGETLADIFANVQVALQKEYSVEAKKSALRLYDQQGADFHIDVVPGRFIDDIKTDVFIYQAEGEKSRLKTNLQAHIDHIAGSGVTDAIRLMKLWAIRNGVDIKTFALELAVVDLLKGKSGKDLATQIEHVLTEFRDNIDNLHIEDPANSSGNDLSELLNQAVRNQLGIVAGNTLATIDADNWEGVFGQVAEVSESEVISSFNIAASESAAESRPWCDPTRKK